MLIYSVNQAPGMCILQRKKNFFSVYKKLLIFVLPAHVLPIHFLPIYVLLIHVLSIHVLLIHVLPVHVLSKYVLLSMFYFLFFFYGFMFYLSMPPHMSNTLDQIPVDKTWSPTESSRKMKPEVQ